MQIIFVPKLMVTLNSICLKQADNSFYTIISLTGPKQNKDFISQELQILICKFLMNSNMPNMFTSQDFIYQLNLHYTLSELILTVMKNKFSYPNVHAFIEL